MTMLTMNRGPVMTAPAAGIVRLLPPRGLAGDLEVYAAGDPLVEITSPGGRILVAAPGHGFVSAWLGADGAAVAANTPLVRFEETR